MSLQTLWHVVHTQCRYVQLHFTGIFSRVNALQNKPCMLPWPCRTLMLCMVTMCSTSLLYQGWNLRGYLLNNSTVTQVDCLLCLVFVFRGSAQLWSCPEDWSKTTTLCCHLAEQFERKTFEGKTPIFDRLQVLHRHRTARGTDPRAVLLQHEPWHTRIGGKYQVCFKIRWETYGRSYHQCHLPWAGSFITCS